MARALFINGIYDGVCSQILEAQKEPGARESFLQPYSSRVIKMLKNQPPTPETPVTLYISTTGELSKICYVAEIIRWEDKRYLSEERRQEVIQQLQRWPGEVKLVTGDWREGEKPVNLLTIRALRQTETLHSTSLLRKVSDGHVLRRRTRSGGWSEVYDLGELVDLPAATKQQHETELATEVEAAKGLSDGELQARLSSAPRLPAKVQIASVAYRRNPDVIVVVLRRANGFCEKCREAAPFLRRSDGSPYLEVHHWTPLGDGGEDTVENAAALCPNCHREVHHGTPNSSSVRPA